MCLVGAFGSGCQWKGGINERRVVVSIRGRGMSEEGDCIGMSDRRVFIGHQREDDAIGNEVGVTGHSNVKVLA